MLKPVRLGVFVLANPYVFSALELLEILCMTYEGIVGVVVWEDEAKGEDGKTGRITGQQVKYITKTHMLSKTDDSVYSLLNVSDVNIDSIVGEPRLSFLDNYLAQFVDDIVSGSYLS